MKRKHVAKRRASTHEEPMWDFIIFDEALTEPMIIREKKKKGAKKSAKKSKKR